MAGCSGLSHIVGRMLCARWVVSDPAGLGSHFGHLCVGTSAMVIFNLDDIVQTFRYLSVCLKFVLQGERSEQGCREDPAVPSSRS